MAQTHNFNFTSSREFVNELSEFQGIRLRPLLELAQWRMDEHLVFAARPERAHAGFNSFLLIRGGSANFFDTLLLIKLKTDVSENIKNRLKFRNDF